MSAETSNKRKSTNNMTTEEVAKYPKKAHYRSRAHSNPLNESTFPVPISPDHYDWSDHYPKLFKDNTDPANPPRVAFADVGCGFGGMTIKLAETYPDKLVVGMEIRDRVCEFVHQRVLALRKMHPGQYLNAAAIKTNAMRTLPNYFNKGQLEKLFFLFPDPHFKEKNHRRRIIQTTLLDEYAFLLKPGGVLYTITDVEELGGWMKNKLEGHSMFERLSEEEMEADAAAVLLNEATEEGQKVKRNGGKTWRNVYRRV